MAVNGGWWQNSGCSSLAWPCCPWSAGRTVSATAAWWRPPPPCQVDKRCDDSCHEDWRRKVNSKTPKASEANEGACNWREIGNLGACMKGYYGCACNGLPWLCMKGFYEACIVGEGGMAVPKPFKNLALPRRGRGSLTLVAIFWWIWQSDNELPKRFFSPQRWPQLYF